MLHEHLNQGTCSVLTRVELNNDATIKNLEVIGGCNGNLKGICTLVKGRKAQEVKDMLRGITCGNKGTSCPDQLARALNEILAR